MSEFVRTQDELRANLTEQIREVIVGAEKEGRGLDSSEVEKIDRIEADIRKADEAIEIANRNEERKAELSTASRGFVPVSEERADREILRDLGLRGGSHTFEKRNTIVSTNNTVPTTFFDQVYDVARLVGPMLDTSEIFNTTTGEDFRIPKLNAYSVATLKGEGTALDDDDPTYDSIVLEAYKYGQLISVANELVVDAGFDIEAHLAGQAGNAIGFAVNEALTTGSGSSQPNGVVTASAEGIEGDATDGTFNADELISLQYTLDGAARRLPGVAYMANGKTIGQIRRLKDGDDTFLYQVNVGQPDTFAGYEVVENPAMADVAAGEKSVLFGHLPSFKVRMAGGLQVATSADFAFNKDLTTYRFLMRVDGDLTHDGHIKHFLGGSA